MIGEGRIWAEIWGRAADGGSVLMATEVTLFGIGTLTKGGLGVKATEGGLVVKTTEVGEDVWDLDISRWDDVAIMEVGSVAIMGVEDKLPGGEFGMMDANKESFFFL